MSRPDQLNKAAQHLNQAISAATQSYPNDQTVLEAKTLMKQALQKLQKASVKNKKIKEHVETNHAKWWGDVVANAPMANMSLQAGMKSLKQLDAMWKEQQNVIDSVEGKVAASLAAKSPLPLDADGNDIQFLRD